MTDTLPQITLNGAAQERGFQHGQQLAERIGKTVEFYTRVFNKPEAELFDLARHFQQKIQAFNADYATEIEALAEGADIDPLYIYALNARSEILSLSANECTALYLQSSGLLGQNWDWAKPLEDLMVLMRIKQPNAPHICMLTEPGIIGKIGMNSAGLGVCLNILRVNKNLDGVPVHIVLRAVLDSENIDQALERVKAAGLGKASNVLVADSKGGCFSAEFAGDESFIVESTDNALIHTNHYLGKKLNPDAGSYCSSYARMRTATEKVGHITEPSIDAIKSILLDRSDQRLPINRSYIIDEELGKLGTVCTIIMDLPNQTIHLKKGNDPAKDFVTYPVREKTVLKTIFRG